MAVQPFKVKAVFDYSSPHDDDLSFPNGQIITVTEEEDAEWYIGEYTDQSGEKHAGLFPRNFVERYEPAAPPRPLRSRPKKEEPRPVEPEAHTADDTISKSTNTIESTRSEPEITPPSQSPKIAQSAAVKTAPVKPVTAGKPPPPTTAEKPSGNSFKDRIAAFNKSTAPPVAPKPTAPAGGSTFIKKPFVAPPPARNAYIPPPQQAAQPQKVYRRDEDPEVAESQAQAQRDAEQAGLAGGHEGHDGERETETPKATSLKDRIALLQKQQQEQAARKAEAGSKEKAQRSTEISRGPESTEEGPELAKVASPPSLRRQASTSSLDATTSATIHHDPRKPIEPSLRDIASDGNDADQSGAGETTEDAGASSTEVDDSDERTRVGAPSIPSRSSTGGVRNPEAEDLAREEDSDNGHEGEDKKETHTEEVEGEEEIDPEIRRKAELRERMAKMSGGMGMAGIFGGGMPVAKTASAPKRPTKETDCRKSSHETASPPPMQRVPIIPVPGKAMAQSPVVEDTQLEIEKEPEMRLPASATRTSNEAPDGEDIGTQPSSNASDSDLEPSVPAGRPLPPPPPAQRSGIPLPLPNDRPAPSTRAVPPPPPRAVAQSPIDEQGARPPANMTESPQETNLPPEPSVPSDLPHRQPSQTASKRGSHPSSHQNPTSTSPPTADTRTSRVPPPLPISSPQMLPAGTSDHRPPPPPPPSALPSSRRSTGREPPASPDDGGSEYEGDYDTDIGSSAHHKNALTAHDRQSSVDEGFLSEDTSFSPPPPNRPNLPPPIPQTQRPAPPPPPQQAPSQSRRSGDAPRAPPPVPPPQARSDLEDEYDPYRYSGGGKPTVPAVSQSRRDLAQEDDPSPYDVSPTDNQQRALPSAATAYPPPPERQGTAPSLPPEHGLPPLVAPSDPRQSAEMSRSSMDPGRRSTTGARRSMDPGNRPTGNNGQIAQDVDLAEATAWWMQQSMPPPVFQNRPDVLLEFEESSNSKRGGRTTVSKDVYVLFQDYSQTVITARFDPKDPATTSQLEQRHEPPPPRLRQDQLEDMHARFGALIASFVETKLSGATILGDGTSQSLVVELLRSAAPAALLPVGTRAYGALIYANLANATIAQHDEIRPGDIVSFRNARFQGKHGAMHAKYAVDIGKPEHRAVVMEWDGTRKKIKAWEQGREGAGKKGRLEGFRVGDLRSGEVKVWRVVGRDWVGWEGES